MRRGRSRTVAERVSGLYANQSLSHPPNRFQLRPHKAPELAKLKAASSGGIRLTWPLELAHECAVRRKYFVVAESLRGATVSLGDLLGLQDTVFGTHFREPTMVIIE